jgi:hypothetical protein
MPAQSFHLSYHYWLEAPAKRTPKGLAACKPRRLRRHESPRWHLGAREYSVSGIMESDDDGALHTTMAVWHPHLSNPPRLH